MAIRVLFFATYADMTGLPEAELDLPVPATVREVVARLRATIPGAGRLPECPLVAVNQAHATLDTLVRDRDELAILPPMAGG